MFETIYVVSRVDDEGTEWPELGFKDRLAAEAFMKEREDKTGEDYTITVLRVQR